MGEYIELEDRVRTRNERKIVTAIIVVSILVPLLVALLLLYPDVLNLNLGIDRGTLPAFHATLNGITAILLVLALLQIRKGKINSHRNIMLAAFGLSVIFLVSYVLSKLNADPVVYTGEMRGLYLFVLMSHIALSIPVVPLALFSVYRGLSKEFPAHRKIVRWTYPIWLYVAITGVLVYMFMKPYY